MTLFDQLHEARWRFASNNPVHASRAILSPGYLEALEAERGELLRIPSEEPDRILGILFEVSRNLPAEVLAVFYSGPEPFDPQHPERTMVLRKGKGVS